MTKIKLISARSVERLPSGFHSDGGNLFLRVRDDSRVWFFRYKKAGKQRSIGLGATHTRSLAQAREIAALMRTAIANGKNPADELKSRSKSVHMTFKIYASAFIEAKRESWRNSKHAKQWNSTLEQYAYPLIGNKQPVDITVTDLKAVLSPIWATKTETASRVRMRIEAILDYAAVHEDHDRRNPARWKGNLDKLFPAPRKISKPIHFSAAIYSDIPRIMLTLRNKNSLSAYCLRFTILTAARSGEVRGATWGEMDINQKVWKIPATRMKANRTHTVPLCDEAIEILNIMQQLQSDNTTLVFPGERGGRLSDVAVNKTLHAIAPGITVHGFRSSFRVWGAETTNIPNAVLELALAHVNKNQVEAAYQRSDLFERRRELMRAWGNYCAQNQ